MKLVCPSCASSFLVDATAIGPAGRTVRCGRCGTSWLAGPAQADSEDGTASSQASSQEPAQEPAQEPVPDPSLEPSQNGNGQAADASDASAPVPVSEPAEHDQVRRRSRRAGGLAGSLAGGLAGAEIHQEKSRHGALGGWLLFGLAFVAVVAGFVLGRQQIMAWAPESTTLYAAVGLAEETPLPSLPRIQLMLRDVTSDRRQVNGMPSLVIEGKVFNPTDETQDVPPLVATLMDPTGIELKRWVFAAESERLAPGGHAAFQTSTDNPPGQGNLNLNFVPRRSQ